MAPRVYKPLCYLYQDSDGYSIFLVTCSLVPRTFIMDMPGISHMHAKVSMVLFLSGCMMWDFPLYAHR